MCWTRNKKSIKYFHRVRTETRRRKALRQLRVLWSTPTMQSSMITIRALSRLMKNKFSTFLEPSSLRANPHFISVVCGFPKDLRSKYQIGKFGDDAWFSSTNKRADVIGEWCELCKTTLISSQKIPSEVRARWTTNIDFFSSHRSISFSPLQRFVHARRRKNRNMINWTCYAASCAKTSRPLSIKSVVRAALWELCAKENLEPFMIKERRKNWTLISFRVSDILGSSFFSAHHSFPLCWCWSILGLGVVMQKNNWFCYGHDLNG